MQTMRESWTDERLDDFRENVNARFDRVDARFDRFDAQVDGRFDRVERGTMEGFARVDRDLGEIRRAMFALGGVMITGFLSLAGLVIFYGV